MLAAAISVDPAAGNSRQTSTAPIASKTAITTGRRRHQCFALHRHPGGARAICGFRDLVQQFHHGRDGRVEGLAAGVVVAHLGDGFVGFAAQALLLFAQGVRLEERRRNWGQTPFSLRKIGVRPHFLLGGA
jgi:hypothetical protein